MNKMDIERSVLVKNTSSHGYLKKLYPETKRHIVAYLDAEETLMKLTELC